MQLESRAKQQRLPLGVQLCADVKQVPTLRNCALLIRPLVQILVAFG